MTDIANTPPRKSALGMAYRLAVAVCAMCLALFSWRFGVDMIIDTPDAGPMIRNAAITLLGPLGPATFGTFGALALRLMNRTPSRFFQIAVIVFAVWSAGMIWLLNSG
ncbi:MAG: hypothetical protein AAGA87_01605 [Pseudomonadota bacterium]